MVDLFTTFLYRGHPRDDAIRQGLIYQSSEENLQPGSEKNFQRKGTDLYSARDIAFDFDSVMMYGPTYFGILYSSGKRKTTIQPLVPGSFCHENNHGLTAKQNRIDELFEIAQGTRNKDGSVLCRSIIGLNCLLWSYRWRVSFWGLQITMCTMQLKGGIIWRKSTQIIKFSKFIQQHLSNVLVKSDNFNAIPCHKMARVVHSVVLKKCKSNISGIPVPSSSTQSPNYAIPNSNYTLPNTKYSSIFICTVCCKFMHFMVYNFPGLKIVLTYKNFKYHIYVYGLMGSDWRKKTTKPTNQKCSDQLWLPL